LTLPKFLENALRHEASKKGLTGKAADKYVFGGMNSIGAMKGSKETQKGKEMEKKHMADEKMGKFERTTITHHGDGSHTVEHMPKVKMQKGGAFMDRGEATSYSAGNGNELVSKLKKNLGIGAAPSPKTEEAELKPSEPLHGSEQGEYEDDEEGS
jgi:hypothetical protein